MDISNQIKTRREAMGLSQEQLAEKLYVSRQTISNWERDKTHPDVQSPLMLSDPIRSTPDTPVKRRRDRWRKRQSKEIASAWERGCYGWPCRCSRCWRRSH